MSKMELDMVNRDPNNLNDHIKVMFEDILAEPDGTHSFNPVWTGSYFCFNCCKNCCYKLMTLFCSVPLTMCWGLDFAVISFYHVWLITPYLRRYMIYCSSVKKFYETGLQCILQPCYQSMGFLFSNIRVTTTRG